MSDLRPQAGARKKPRTVRTNDAPVLAAQGRKEGASRKRLSPSTLCGYLTPRIVKVGTQFILCVIALTAAVFVGWIIGIHLTL